jgi:hypothetical protein
MGVKHVGTTRTEHYVATPDNGGGGSFIGVVVVLVFGIFALKACFGG